MYTGFIYNNLFSKSINTFGSHWHTNYNESTIMTNKDLQMNPSLTKDYDQVPYPMGVDPVWQVKTIYKLLEIASYMVNCIPMINKVTYIIVYSSMFT